MNTLQIRELLKTIFDPFIILLLLCNIFIFGLYHVPTGSAEPNVLVGDRIWGNKTAYYWNDVKRGDLVIFSNPVFNYAQEGSLRYYWQRYVGFPVSFLGLPQGPDNWVKRVIAVPGDVIEGRLEEGKTVIYLNGEKLNEPYVNPYPLASVRTTRGFIPWRHIGPLATPSFLQYETKVCHYTYDPSKSYADQPFYSMSEATVVCTPGTDQPELIQPFTPSYHGRILGDVFGPYTVPAGKYWVMGDSRKNSVDSRWWLFLDKSLIFGRASFVIYSVDSQEAFWLFDLIKHPIDFWMKHVRYNRFFKSLNGYAEKN